MTTKGKEKTGKIADARQEVATARQKVESIRTDLFTGNGNFEDKARALNCAMIDLVRKEERFEELKTKTGLVRDDRQTVRVFRSSQCE